MAFDYKKYRELATTILGRLATTNKDALYEAKNASITH